MLQIDERLLDRNQPSDRETSLYFVYPPLDADLAAGLYTPVGTGLTIAATQKYRDQ